jgi:hypothetical protein
MCSFVIAPSLYPVEFLLLRVSDNKLFRAKHKGAYRELIGDLSGIIEQVEIKAKNAMK